MTVLEVLQPPVFIILINFCEFGFTEDFVGFNFRELSLTKDFAGINFRENALYKDLAGVNLTFALTFCLFCDLSLWF